MAEVGKLAAEVVIATLALAGIIQALGRGWEGWRGDD